MWYRICSHLEWHHDEEPSNFDQTCRNTEKFLDCFKFNKTLQICDVWGLFPLWQETMVALIKVLKNNRTLCSLTDDLKGSSVIPWYPKFQESWNCDENRDLLSILTRNSLYSTSDMRIMIFKT